MRKIKTYIIILITIIFMSSFLTHNQAISSTENQLTAGEIALFLNDVHHSLDVVAQKSELALDQKHTYFSSAKSSYFIGFAIGALGSAAVAKSANIAAKINNLNNIAMVGATVAGAVTGAVVITTAPAVFVGSFAVAGTAAVASIKYAAISSAFATILGFISSRENSAILANIDGATYMNSHYRMKMHYKLSNGFRDDLEDHCLLAFSIETWSPGFVINYEIDDCSDDKIFPQTQVGWNLRTGGYVDVIDKAMGQDMVVTSGQVKIRQN